MYRKKEDFCTRLKPSTDKPKFETHPRCIIINERF